MLLYKHSANYWYPFPPQKCLTVATHQVKMVKTNEYGKDLTYSTERYLTKCNYVFIIGQKFTFLDQPENGESRLDPKKEMLKLA